MRTFSCLLAFVWAGFSAQFAEAQEGVRWVKQLDQEPKVITEDPPCNCKDWKAYLPDHLLPNAMPPKVLRVNVHYMRNSNGEGNVGWEEGRKYAQDVIAFCNYSLEHGNQKMRLPLGNNTPVLRPRFQYALTKTSNSRWDIGVHFHVDNEHYFMIDRGKDQNNFSDFVYKQYARGKDSILNLFVMASHPDSLSKGFYPVSEAGVGFGLWAKVNHWNEDRKVEGMGAWYSQKNLNHEIGHCLGLAHAWGIDGCDDTPRHNNNCWAKTKNGSVCDSLVSNNVMDYNEERTAWTPCQVGRIHSRLSDKSDFLRAIVKKDWCVLDRNYDVIINGNYTWEGHRDLRGHLIIPHGTTLTIRCRVSMPERGEIIIQPGGQLVLDGAQLENDCGKTWRGIAVEGNGVLIVKNKSTMSGTAL